MYAFAIHSPVLPVENLTVRAGRFARFRAGYMAACGGVLATDEAMYSLYIRLSTGILWNKRQRAKSVSGGHFNEAVQSLILIAQAVPSRSFSAAAWLYRLLLPHKRTNLRLTPSL